MRRRGLIGRAAVLVAFLAASAAADGPRATGFVAPSFVPNVRRVGSSAQTRASLLGATEPLPSRWDSREHGWMTPVKNQGGVGTCWSYASYAVLETQLLKAGRGEYEFSVKNMVNLHGFAMEPDDGGNYHMSGAYLLRWNGPVAETNDVYVMNTNNWTSSPVLPPILHVQHVVWTPEFGTSADATNELKAAIRKYGAVATTVGWFFDRNYEASNTYYNVENLDVNHAITAVGWDDDFPASAFAQTPPSNGAWLIKNSWGNYGGDGGYFWISYWDASFGHDSTPTVFIPAGDDENYDVIRGYDRLGVSYDVTASYEDDPLAAYDLQASVFTSSWNEELAAVGVHSSIYPNPYEISVYTNVAKGAATPVEGGVLAFRQTGTLTHAGFTTIHLDSPIKLPDTNAFAVVYRQTGDTRSTCVSCTITGTAFPTNHPGTCYVGYVTAAGTNDWLDAFYEADRVDVTDISWATCIKAYTRFASRAPAGDAPAESDEGAAMMADLEANAWPWFHETAETFGAVANAVGANGRSLWASWLAGLTWSSPESTAFTASIEMVGGKPSVTWDPDLGAARTYTVYGRAALDDENGWVEVDPADPGATGAKFFKVTVGK